MEYIRQGKVCWHAGGAGKVRVLWAQGLTRGDLLSPHPLSLFFPLHGSEGL